MIRSSIWVKAGAVCLALGVHGGMAVSFNAPSDISVEADAGARTTALGSSFADMAAGTLAPSEPTERVKPDVTKLEPLKSTAPLAKPAVPVIPPVQHIASAQAAETATALSTVEKEQRTSPETLQAAPVKPRILTATQSDSAAAVTRSTRPRTRSPELEKRAAAAKPKPPKGNAAKTAKAGSSSGLKKAKATKQGSSGKARQAGNAAISNYPGRVMARISSVGRPSVRARGTAVIRFSVNSRGGLASAGVARSSGSSALDRAAINVIYNAAPFPRPPAGARRTFSINITGR